MKNPKVIKQKLSVKRFSFLSLNKHGNFFEHPVALLETDYKLYCGDEFIVVMNLLW